MAQLELIDRTWIRANPGRVAARVARSDAGLSWCPGVAVVVTEDRGELGRRWQIAADQPVRGSAEIWLEAMYDGVVLHYFFRADRVAGPWSRRALGRERDRRRRQARRAFWALKDELEAPVGTQSRRVT
jgi:hypothetical protein